jgi:hypothetical protein
VSLSSSLSRQISRMSAITNSGSRIDLPESFIHSKTHQESGSTRTRRKGGRTWRVMISRGMAEMDYRLGISSTSGGMEGKTG